MLAESNFNFSSNDFGSFSSDESTGETEVCIANISPKERKKRLNFAIQYLVFTLLILAVLLLLDLNPLWRLPLFLMFAASASSFFQWRDKT